MNYSAFILELRNVSCAVLLASVSGCCATRRSSVSTEAGALPVVRDFPPQAAPWSPAQVTPYTVGRYVDPRRPDILHEGHRIYRQERTRHPNLAPPDWVVYPGLGTPPHPNSAGILHDALTAELNQQRQTSAALIEEAKKLDAHLKQLHARSEDFRQVANRQAVVIEQLQKVEARIRLLEGRSPTHVSPSPDSLK